MLEIPRAGIMEASLMTDVAQQEKVEPAATEFRSVGKPLPRNEDQRLITGRGRFSDDFSVPGQAPARGGMPDDTQYDDASDREAGR